MRREPSAYLDGVLYEIAQGHRHRIIADKLGLSVHTVREYVKRLKQELADEPELAEKLMPSDRALQWIAQRLLASEVQGGASWRYVPSDEEKALVARYLGDRVAAGGPEDSSLAYWQELHATFWRGEYERILREVAAAESYIFDKGLHTERRGRLWLVAMSAIKANALVHALPHAVLERDPAFGLREIERVGRFVEPGSRLTAIWLVAWGSVLRLGGEHGGRRSEELLLRSLDYRERALHHLAADDPLRVLTLTETMATSADLEILFPDRADHLLGAGRGSQEREDRARNTAARLARAAELYEPAIDEFAVRWGLRRIDAARKRRSDHRAPDEVFANMEVVVRNAQQRVAATRGDAAIVAVTLAVTRANIYQVRKAQAPPDVQDEAIRLVLRSNDAEQRYRLLYGLGLRGV